MNPLTDEEVDKLFAEAESLRAQDPPAVALRSCWNCNPAHERLKQADCLIMCFSCGGWYLRGHNLSELSDRTTSAKP